MKGITVKIRAEIQIGASAPQHVGRIVTAKIDEPATDIRNAVTLALREVHEEVKDVLP